MPVSEDLRDRIRATHALLEAERRPCGTPHIARYLRYERPIELTPDDEDALIEEGWKAVVSKTMRSIATSGGARTVLSTPGDEGRNYKQLSFVFLPDALGILQSYHSSEIAYRIQRQGWWQICERLRAMPEGTTVADLFPGEDRWDHFWQAIRDSDLWDIAA